MHIRAMTTTPIHTTECLWIGPIMPKGHGLYYARRTITDIGGSMGMELAPVTVFLIIMTRPEDLLPVILLRAAVLLQEISGPSGMDATELIAFSTSGL